MNSFAQRFTEQGFQQVFQHAFRQGVALMLNRQMERKFGPLSPAQRRRIEAADAETLLACSENALTATRPEEVLC